jgi:hypothetical protein
MNSDSEVPWVVRIPTNGVSQVAQLRLIEGLEVLVDAHNVWLRGTNWDSQISQRIRSIAEADRFMIRPDQQMTRIDETVPCGRLPEGNWRSLRSWIQLQLPGAGFAASSRDRVTLRLVRSSTPKVANVLETTWTNWSDYAISAPLVRLDPLAFALSDRDIVLVWGTPQPPIPGRRYVESNGVIVPCGWRFEPDVGTAVACRVLSLQEGEFAFFHEDGSFERIAPEAFVRASRSAVRSSHD